jgi:hypothetical protein
MRWAAFAGLAVVLIANAPASAALTYSWDDGTGDWTLGAKADADFIFLNHFTVVPGGTVLNNVSVAWGDVPAGRAATIAIWQNAPGNGDPHSAQLLRAVDVTVVHPNPTNTDVFDLYSIPATTVSGELFVGVRIGALHNGSTNEYPGRFDDNPSLDNPPVSWMAASLPGQSDLTDLSLAVNGTVLPLTSVNLSQAGSFKGAFMIRADATAPEPASASILALGIVGLMLRRRSPAARRAAVRRGRV